jgi:hypothetical protein
MINVYLMFLCAFALSGAAAFYSIAGLIAIFAAAPMAIAIMGSALEVSKLVIASWLYHNWKDIPALMKGYLTTALVVLMFLTSMGIFGFLSKAHMEQGVPIGDTAAKVALIDEKITTEKENLNAARKAIAQLDEQVNQTISRTTGATDDTAVSRSIAIRRGQARERTALTSDIGAAQARLAKLTEERAPLATDLRKIEAEVGPIKYIAALVYEEDASNDSLEKAVRWVTLLIVAVFDPLAVSMLIAASWSLARARRETPILDPPVKTEPTEDKNITQPDDSDRKVVVVEEKITKPKRSNKKVKPVEDWQIPPPPVEAVEHPAFTLGNENWGSRPPSHLDPKDPRRR